MSNISIVYGFEFDIVDISGDLDEAMDLRDGFDKELPEGVTLITPYSCSAFEPTKFMIGFELQTIDLFCPTPLNDVVITSEQIRTLRGIEFPWESNDDPGVMVFGHNDD